MRLISPCLKAGVLRRASDKIASRRAVEKCRRRTALGGLSQFGSIALFSSGWLRTRRPPAVVVRAGVEPATMPFLRRSCLPVAPPDHEARSAFAGDAPLRPPPIPVVGLVLGVFGGLPMRYSDRCIRMRLTNTVSKAVSALLALALPTGLEPVTHGLTVRCSTN